MITVGFDGRFLTSPFSGNGRYSVGLVKALRRDGPERGVELVVFGDRTGSEEVTVDTHIPSGRVARWLTTMPRELKNNRPQVFHGQYSLPRGAERNTHTVLAIHDAAFAIRGFPEYSWTKTILFGAFADRAKRVVTVSQSARRDLECYVPQVKGKIEVVPNGCELIEPTENDSKRVQDMLRLFDGPVVLFIGRLAKRKRIPLLIEAFDQIVLRESGAVLIIAGPDDDDSPVINRMIAGKMNIIRLTNVSESIKAALYHQASVFVYLSQYEGFGLPVAEALVAGVPVVHSDIPSLVEVGEGSTFVTRQNVADISTAMLDALRQSRGPSERFRKKFSWQRAARTYIALYRELVGP